MSSAHDQGPDPTPGIPSFFRESDIDIKAFDRICSQSSRPADVPLSETIDKNVPVYSGERVRNELSRDHRAHALEREWCHCLNSGPGVFVVLQAYSNKGTLDSMTEVFRKIILDERSGGVSKGDHFGNNERIWNSFQKSFACAPETAIDYYGNPVLALASRSWLGPHYQISAQVNIVKPGSEAQSPHRDYHLGFQSDETIATFPAHAQVMSQYLTLQGGIAHSDMPLESGPTLLLPYSHQYPMGYMAFRRPEFIELFESRKVQLPLRQGDAIFFNPALFHGAGANSSDQDRIGNLVQISSAFGRTMETIDHRKIVEIVYPVLLERKQQRLIDEADLDNMITAVAEDYSFPTNLDTDPPISGNAPQSMQMLLQIALQNEWPATQFLVAVENHFLRHQS